MARVIVTVDGRPAAGVAVSDGVSTWTTADDGTVEVTAPDGPFAQLSVPTGCEPVGPWWAPWAGEVGFALGSTDQSLPLSFAQITDLHLSAGPEPVRLTHPDGLYGWDDAGTLRSKPLSAPADVLGALGGVLAAAPAAGFPAPSFAVATGDLTDHGTAAEFALLAEVTARAPVPLLVLPGNHDHYGHHHDPAPEDRPEESSGMGTMTTWRYERHVGPRWWSRTWAGLRLVAVDWFAWRVGADGERQETWLAGDLATAAAGTPVLFLTHDHMPSSFFARMANLAPHVRVVGSLSGHWHTSRVVRVGGELHVNTGNATFGSYDWSPAHGRLFRWDGEHLDVHTVAVPADAAHHHGTTFRAAPAAPTGPGRWAVRLPGAVHLAAPVLADDGQGAEVVVCAWGDDDRAAGGLVGIDPADGSVRWAVALDAPVWATPGTSGELVVAVSVNGGVVALDARDGTVRWRTQVGDPRAMWVHATPLIDTDRHAVYVGEYRTFAALGLGDGSLRWQRNDFGSPENYVTVSSPALAGGVLVAGFGMYEPNLYGLDPDNGATLWAGTEPEHRCPLTEVVAIEGTGDVVLGRMGGRFDRLDGATGALRWKARLDALFLRGRPAFVQVGTTPAAPATDTDVVVTTGAGDLYRLDGRTGAVRWRRLLDGSPPLPFGPYRRNGAALACGPTLGDAGVLWQPATDGTVHRLDAADGTTVELFRLPGPITAAALVLPGGDAVVATADGGLHRLPAG
jgi:outer membrane protein assembly factor BamB